MKKLPLQAVFSVAVSVVVILLALVVLIYPAVVTARVLLDSTLRTTGQSRFLPAWFVSAAPRFRAWADDYLERGTAAAINPKDVAATEWPMFGSVFFLVTAAELQRQGPVDARSGVVREAVESAGRVVASPVTATWVRTMWGSDYLDRENVFYRMLLLLGLSSYEEITGNTQYRELLSSQRRGLAAELSAAPLHLLDDYPGECYPSDILWAVAALQRAARLEGTNHHALAADVIASFNGPVRAAEGLPAFQAESRSGRLRQGARGSGNSGILAFAAELDAQVAGDWYRAYEQHFWKDTGWLAGFTELPRGSGEVFMDVDSGPVLFEFGSVASAFGIGAARTVGRYDHAAPLTMEAVACCWPTSFGFLIPGVMGYAAARSWSLGEVALLFSMTRPTYTQETVPFQGHAPHLAWLLVVAYASLGVIYIRREVRSCRRKFRQYVSSE